MKRRLTTSYRWGPGKSICPSVRLPRCQCRRQRPRRLFQGRGQVFKGKPLARPESIHVVEAHHVSSEQAADAVVEEVKKLGGRAVPNYDSVENGESIINAAIQNFGRIDILINNAGILRDVSFKNMKDQDWDLIFAVHVTGAYKVR